MTLDLGRRLRGKAARATLVLVVLGAAAAAAGLLRSLESDTVAAFEVERGRFVREVEGRGLLKAVNATPIVAPVESGRPQKIAFLARDGAVVTAGDTVVEFDPYDAQKEEADGKDDLAAAEARIARAEADARKNERSHTLDRDVARDELDRAETFQLTDEYLYTRHQIVESRLDKELYATRADVADQQLETSGELSAAEKQLGRIDAGKARLKLDIAEKSLRSLRIVAPHDGILVLERNWRGETAFVGDTVWPGPEDRRDPRALRARGEGLRPRGGRRGPRRRGSPPASRSRDARARCTRPRWRGSSPWPRPGAGARRCGTSRRPSPWPGPTRGP